MNITFSTCPNDTFIFHAWVYGLLPSASKLKVTYADINLTNELAMNSNGPDILKISCAALPYIHSGYEMLPCGGAAGRGCGPLVLTKDKPLDKITRIAIPSKRSTAYLLFKKWSREERMRDIEIVVLPFDQIMPAIESGSVCGGLVIHEARFTYANYGLTEIIDLGAWWENKTRLPIPLGVIVAKKYLDLSRIVDCIRASLDYAWKHPAESEDYVLKHAKEMTPDVARAHIGLYVNDFTYDLGEEGHEAIRVLLDKCP